MGGLGYYVVLTNNGEKAAFCFENKREFERWYIMFKHTDKIIEQGITANRAIDLSDCINQKSRFAKFILQEI